MNRLGVDVTNRRLALVVLFAGAAFTLTGLACDLLFGGVAEALAALEDDRSR
jgi:hypothetical protein